MGSTPTIRTLRQAQGKPPFRTPSFCLLSIYQMTTYGEGLRACRGAYRVWYIGFMRKESEESNRLPGRWSLYIAQSISGKYYVGITTDIAKRIKDHNAGRGSQLARIDGPFKLRYESRVLSGQSEARKLEIKVKKWNREKKEKLIRGEWEL